MIKKIVLLFLLFLSFVGFSQKCGFDKYLNSLSHADEQMNKKITSEITNIINKRAKGVSYNDEIITIPVVFNLVYPYYYQLGQGSNVYASTLEEQIDKLNDRYAGGLGGVDTKIQFCLAKKDINGFENTGIKRFNGEENYKPFINSNNDFEVYQAFRLVDAEIKKNKDNGFPSDRFLNIWIVNLLDESNEDGLAGYSSLPILDDFDTIDGVVIDYEELNKYTASHEVGHWLGLFHVFENLGITGATESNNCGETNCETQGDFICDTDTVPEEGTNNIAPGACNGYNCNNQVTNVVRNFMDYQAREREYCYTTFTQGQKDRMRDILEQYRTTIYQNSLFNLNDYCSASEDPIDPDDSLFYIFDYCDTCYEPSIKVPIFCGEKQHYEAQYKSNLLVNTTGLRSSEIAINIYNVVCDKIEEEQTFNITANNNANLSINIINDNFFIIHRENYYNSKNLNQLRLYKKTNGSWSLNQTITLDLDVVNFEVTQHGYFITTRTYSPIEEKIYKIDLNTGYKTLIEEYNVSNYDKVVKLTKKGYVISRKSGEIEEWHYNYSTNTYNLENTINLPLRSYLVDTSLGFSYSENHIVVYEWVKSGTNSGVISPIIYQKLTNNNWVELQLLNFDYNVGSLGFPYIINDEVIVIHSKGTNYYNGQVFFFKKNNTTGLFEPKENLLHLNPLDTYETDYIKSAKLSINDERKEIFIGDQILKIEDVFQTDEDTILSNTTTDVCSIVNNDFIYNDYNITLAENCNLVLDNATNTFVANNRVNLMPGLRIKGGSVSIKTTKNYNNCIFTESCNNANYKLFNNDYLDKVALDESQNLNEVVIHPNPTNGTFIISTNEATTKYTIFNSLGNKLTEKEINSNKIAVDIQNFPSGIYIIHITLASGKLVVKKIIKN